MKTPSKETENEMMLKLIKEEWERIENLDCFSIEDFIEKRNAFNLVKNIYFEVFDDEDYSNENGKILLNKLLEDLK